ncbi:MAG: hypothetical protein JWM59_2674 [Verrucomicrobiales bacterium]|nr:hypothetical protein [Verrucomicrobiales bacterium]
MTEQPTTRFPTFRRLAVTVPKFFLRLPGRLWRLFRRVFLSRKSVVVYAVLGTGIGLFYAGCSWHYRRAWEKEKKRIIASGSSLDISRLLPPMPREEDNFFATPVMKEFYSTPEDAPTRLTLWFLPKKRTTTVIGKNGKLYEKPIPQPNVSSLTDYCEWLRQYGNLPKPAPASPSSPGRELLEDHRHDDIFQELEAAAKRPESRVPKHHEDPLVFGGMPFKIGPIRRMVDSLGLRARALVAAGQAGKAVETLRVTGKIGDGYANSGTLIGVLISPGYRRTDEVLMEGMRGHLWTDEALTELLRMDPRTLYHKAWAKASETERAFRCNSHENYATAIIGQSGLGLGAAQRLYLRIYPDGLWIRDCILNSRYSEAWGSLTGPLRAGESWASRADQLRAFPDPGLAVLNPFNNQKEFNNMLQWVGPCFMRLEITRTAILLERHWLKHRRYPAILAELDPAPPESIPLAMDGRPLRYRTNADGSTFRVWSPPDSKSASSDPGHVGKDDHFFANE